MSKPKRLSTREYARAVAGVLRLSFRTAPVIISLKMAGTLITAVLPIAVTYFAAQTTTELAKAFGGDEAAGRQAIIYVIITAAIGLLTTAWGSIDGYTQQLMRFRVEAKVSDMMFNQFLELDFWQYDDKETADLYDRAKKFSQFYAYAFDRLATLGSQLISVVFTLAALAIFLPWLALFVLIAVIPGVYVQFRISRAQINMWNKTIDSRRAQSYIEWNLFSPSSIAELRLNNLVRHLLELRQTYRNKYELGRLKYERQYLGKRIMADALETVTEFGSLVWIALQIIAQSQPIGQFVYVQQLVSRAMGSSRGFIESLGDIDEDLANLFDYQKFMALPTSRGGGVTLAGPPREIVLDNVSFHYPQAKARVLQNISLTIQAGQHVAIVGENGAGKSTLIKLITGLYHPTRGKILLDGTSLQSVEIDSWHQQLAVLQQDFQRYIFTSVKNNVHFGDVNRVLSDKSVNEALEKAEAYQFVHELPQKLETNPNVWIEDEHGNKGTQLSGGQWQRLALARGFYRDAPIIILDEPTSAIDALAETRIFKRLFAKGSQKTVITISHRLTTVEKADVIVVLERGKVVERGTHAELVAARGVYYTMFESQLLR